MMKTEKIDPMTQVIRGSIETIAEEMAHGAVPRPFPRSSGESGYQARASTRISTPCASWNSTPMTARSPAI